MPTGQTLCLSMIVKDEASVIRRCLASIRPIIDHWIVVDTGSTDGTQAIVREAMAGLPGSLVERPWRDFAHNRSEALDLARPHGDYTLIIDADDTLRLPPDFAMPRLDADSYVLDIADAGVAYQRTQIVRNSLPWRYRGVLHEFLTCEGAFTTGSLPVTMLRNHDGARRRDPQTYHRDAQVLERALGQETDPFLISRYTFYLAQSYRDCGEPEKALRHYLARADLGFWDEEIFVALLQAGRLMERLGRDLDTTLATYQRASAACPTRAEAAHAASRLCRLNDRFAQGYAVATPALARVAPPGGLFVEPWIYDYGLRDEYAVNAYWAGHHRECLAACLDLLARNDLPEADRSRVAANARHARDRLAERLPAEAAGALPPAVSSDWTPNRPQGGTELMVEGLRERLGTALDAIELCVNTEPTGSGRPTVVWVHHDIDQAAVQWLDDAAGAGRVDRFVFVSDWQRRRFVERFRLRPERCRVLRNATAVPVADRLPRQDRSPLRLAYASTPYRGLAVLLDAWDRAWNQLDAHGAELHIWSSHKLYGPGSDDAPYQELYARAAALPGVTYHGITPNAELRRALGAIDILAYPSTFAETSCLIAIEAMAAGCRLICPDLGALPETTAGFARLYPTAVDPAEHAQVFADLLVDEVARPWAGAPARAAAQQEHARSLYDWPIRVAEWRSFIAELVPPESATHPGRRDQPASPAGRAFETPARSREHDLSRAASAGGASEPEARRRSPPGPPDDNRSIGSRAEPLDHEHVYRRFLQEMDNCNSDRSNMTTFWREQSLKIAADARTGSPFDFLRWPSLEPFSAPEAWIPRACYEELHARPDWASSWFPLTRETKVGAPKDYSLDLGTSPILIQHAYHLMRYERGTERSLTDCDVVFEIGGGYGSFCRLLRNRGFAGLHIIYDLPHVSAIQRLYLGLSGLHEVAPEAIDHRTRHGFCLITDQHFDRVYDDIARKKLTVAVVATWSLSETPMAVRDRIFPRFHSIAGKYLFAYQPFWDDIDNTRYFSSLMRDRIDLSWRAEEMPRVTNPPSTYLFA